MTPQIHEIFSAQFLEDVATSDTDREQLSVLMEMFFKFQERNDKYRDLWKQGGWTDSAHHIRHKGARVSILLGPEKTRSDAEAFIGDVIDLGNYCCFFVRNVRAAQPAEDHQLEGGSVLDIERWSVVDRWWTEEPIRREFRSVKLDDGSCFTQYRDAGELVWKVMESK